MLKPFKAPRKVNLCEEDISNSDVQAITETENARDLEARQDKDVFVNPYPKGIKLMSYRMLRAPRRAVWPYRQKCLKTL